MNGLDQLRVVQSSLRPLLFESDAQCGGSAVLGISAAGLTARVVRGRKMQAEVESRFELLETDH